MSTQQQNKPQQNPATPADTATDTEKTGPGRGTARSPRQWLLTGAGIAALAVAIWLPGILTPGLQGDVTLPAADCDVTQPGCNTGNGQQRIAMQLDTQRVRAATPLTFELKLDALPASQVMIDLQGRDMYMGINQVQMSPVEGKPGVWRGTTELAVCTTGEMVWQAKVVADTEQARVTTQFEFKAK
ncbi:MAG: hypothetical protein OIF57_07055 [Marinobacterium sp.]|nr:hypothetical protein [Marinobacterium sp.]